MIVNGKLVNDIQSNIVVDDDNLTITGTLHYVTGMMYEERGTSYDGNFIALNVSCDPSDGVELYAYVSNSSGENGGLSLPKSSPQVICVEPINDNNIYSGYIHVSASKRGYQSISRNYDCSGLTIESAT